MKHQLFGHASRYFISWFPVRRFKIFLFFCPALFAESDNLYFSLPHFWSLWQCIVRQIFKNEKCNLLHFPSSEFDGRGGRGGVLIGLVQEMLVFFSEIGLEVNFWTTPQNHKCPALLLIYRVARLGLFGAKKQIGLFFNRLASKFLKTY